MYTNKYIDYLFNVSADIISVSQLFDESRYFASAKRENNLNKMWSQDVTKWKYP